MLKSWLIKKALIPFIAVNALSCLSEKLVVHEEANKTGNVIYFQKYTYPESKNVFFSEVYMEAKYDSKMLYLKVVRRAKPSRKYWDYENDGIVDEYEEEKNKIRRNKNNEEYFKTVIDKLFEKDKAWMGLEEKLKLREETKIVREKNHVLITKNEYRYKPEWSEKKVQALYLTSENEKLDDYPIMNIIIETFGKNDKSYIDFKNDGIVDFYLHYNEEKFLILEFRHSGNEEKFLKYDKELNYYKELLNVEELINE